MLPTLIFAQNDYQLQLFDEVGNGIKDVAVIELEIPIFVTSDSEGKVTFSVEDETSLENANFTFSHPNFFTKEMSFSVLQGSNYKLTLEERTIILDETVISVTKTIQNSAEISNKVDVIKSKEIEFLNPQTTADMLLSTGNVFVQKSQFGGGSPIIRGFEANKVLLVIDDVRMNNAIYRGGHLQNVITIDEAMLSRTEVIFGPGSLIYGSDAMGGVMSFYTRNPVLAKNDTSLNIFGNASVRYGSVNNEKNAHFDINIGAKKFASLTSFSISDYDDLKAGQNRNPAYGDWGLVPEYVATTAQGNDTVLKNDQPFLQRGTGFAQYDVLQKFAFQAKAHLRIGLNFQFSTTTNVPRFDRLQETTDEIASIPYQIDVFGDTTILSDSTFSFEQPKFAEWNYGPQTRFLSILSISDRKKNKLYHFGNYTLSYQFLQESRLERKLYSDIRESNVEEVQIATLNADFVYNLSTQNKILYGVESNFNLVNSEGTATNIIDGSTTSIQSRYPEDGSTLFTNAVYVKHSAQIAKRASFSQGIRFNHIYLKSKFSDRLFNGTQFDDVTINPIALSFSFDFTVQPKNDWQYNLLFSSGFRAPNVDDVGKVFDPNPQEIVIPNQDLKPEYSYNIETGLSKSFNEKAKIEVVGYFTILSNVITRQAISFNGQDSIFVDTDNFKSQVLGNVNNGFGYITGVSVNLSAALNRRLKLKSTFNYTYGVLQSDNTPMPHIPPIFGRTSLDYEHKKFRSSVWSQYQGWKKLSRYSTSSVDNLNEATEFGTPAWFTLNWTNAYTLNDQVAINFSIENILDQHYRSFGSGVSAAGRNFVIGLRVKY